VVAQAEHVGAIDRPHASTPTGREDVPDVAGPPVVNTFCIGDMQLFSLPGGYAP
jgi:hypothetical protein